MIEIETRLRAELGRLPADPPPVAVLEQIRDRSAAEDLENDPSSYRPSREPEGRSNRSIYLAAVAAGAALLLASVLALSNGSPASPLRTEPARNAALDLAVSPPSYWWLGVVALLSVAAAWAAHRLTKLPLAKIAVGVFGLGCFVWLAATLPSLRSGAELTARAPQLEGFELVSAEVNYRPGFESYELTRLSYAPEPPRTLDDAANYADEQVLEIAAEFGFDSGLPNLSRPCLEVPAEPSPPPSEGLTPYQIRQLADYFCLHSIVDGRLQITASTYSTHWLWYRSFVAYPLMWLAVVLGLLAARELQSGVPRPTSRQVAYGLAVLCFSLALYMVGSLAVATIQVSPVRGAMDDCELAPDVSPVLGPDEDAYNDCYHYMRATFTDAGVADKAEWLYWPLIFVADVLSVLLVLIGWPLGRFATRDDQQPGRRRRLLIGAAVVLVLLVSTQFIFADIIDVTTDVYE